MARQEPAEVFPPGDFLQEELDARGWTQQDLAEIMGCSHRLVNEIVRARRSITPETARALSAALGTSSELWLNLESSYRLHQTKSDDAGVRRRARIYELGPVAEMRRRGWIQNTRDIDELESESCRFYSLDSIDEEPEPWPHAARKSTGYCEVSNSQRAWIFRVRELASRVKAAPFSSEKLDGGLEDVRALAADERGVSDVSRVLASLGVRFLVVQHLSGTRIDGACLWLEQTKPVVAVSLRYDRIDWFWHTLMHELAHVQHRDGWDRPLPPDTNLVGREPTAPDQKPETERRADRFAAEQLIPHRALNAWLRRSANRVSKIKIREFGDGMGIHPGIVVGRLQHAGRISYSHHREMLVKVRDRAVASTLTDGWGYKPKLT